MRTIIIDLIRHGMTGGNALKRYIGRTDEPLSPGGEAQAASLGECDAVHTLLAKDPQSLLVVSPMLRCVQTAACMLGLRYGPDDGAGHVLEEIRCALRMRRGSVCDVVVCDDLRECDFGDFEGKNYRELSGSRAYQQWIDSQGTLPFPGGEDPSAFRSRTCSAFENLLRDTIPLPGHICMVVHGGTIMSILERWGVDENGNTRNYYGWHVENGCGVRALATWENNAACMRLEVLKRIDSRERIHLLERTDHQI